jgi:hypothetical protein
MKRPGLITVVCLLYWFSTLFLGAIGAISLAILFAPYLAGTLPPSEILKDMEMGDPAVIGWGLWKLKRWARPAAIVASGIQIALGVCDTLFTQAGGGVRVPWRLVLHGFALWVVFRKDVKAAFKPTLSEGTEILQQAE